MSNSNLKNSSVKKRKKVGYALFFLPIIFIIVGIGTIVLLVHENLRAKSYTEPLIYLVIIGVLCLPWGIIFGLRMLRNE